MSDKVLIIISTANEEKARTGVMYCLRTLQEGWLEDAQLVFFGPGEQVLVDNPEIQEMVKQIKEVRTPLACKALSDKADRTAKIEALGVDVVYVGRPISDFIKQGYVPMVW